MLVSEDGHIIDVDGARITSERLVIRPWELEDAEQALSIYGTEQVAQWLAPALPRIDSVEAMGAVIAQWRDSCATLTSPEGRWAIEDRNTGQVVGGAALLPLPPDNNDLEVAWQLAPRMWGRGLATEAGHALAHYAFLSGAQEIFAVARPANSRAAATAKRMGMEWVGETTKYYGLALQVYRLRKGDLDQPELATPDAQHLAGRTEIEI
jgi:RimJ/RimL family protein N-acetyltransferase